MALALVVGPAKAGKIARLLAGYLEAIERDPVLIVPNAADVERVQRDLLRRTGALLGGSIGTFDDLFRELAHGGRDGLPVAGDAQRALVVRRALARTSLNGLGRSARFGGFADALLVALGELESGLLDPDQLDGDLGRLYSTYRAELDQLGLWDRDLLRRRAVERLTSELEAWDGRPVFAYGFEDLTGAEWALLEALSGRAEVTVSLPYEPGRPVFASLGRTADDLGTLAAGRIEELPARAADYGHAALAHLERHLFADEAPAGPELEGAIRFFEGAGARGALELTAEEIRELAAAGTAARGDRPRRAGGRALARAGRDRPRHARHSPCDRGTRAARPDAPRAGAARAAPVRLAGGRPPRPVRLPALALLRPRTDERRLPRRAAPRACGHRGRAGGAGDGAAARRSAPAGARGAARRARAGRGRAGARGVHAAVGPRARVAARRRADAARPARTRRGCAAARRARRVGRPRRRALAGRRRLGARAHRCPARTCRGARPRRRARPLAGPNTPLRGRLRARARGGQPAAPRARVAVPRRRGARRARRPRALAADAARSGRPRSLPLLHGLHAGDAAADARARGGERRGEPARAEPVLGGGAGALRP